MDGSPRENAAFIYLILFAGQMGIAKRSLKKKVRKMSKFSEYS